MNSGTPGLWWAAGDWDLHVTVFYVTLQSVPRGIALATLLTVLSVPAAGTQRQPTARAKERASTVEQRSTGIGYDDAEVLLRRLIASGATRGKGEFETTADYEAEGFSLSGRSQTLIRARP
jgi:hypothetical protein